MKKQLFLLCSVFALLLNCSAIDELTKFDLDIQSDYSIPPTTVINTPFNVQTPEVSTESESTFKNNNTNRDLIESIVLTKLTLSIKAPENGNFNFIEEMYIYMNAEGEDEIEIANISNIESSNSKTLELISLGQELKNYLKKDSYSLRVRTTTDETISETHDITIDTKFRVDAKILGL